MALEADDLNLKIQLVSRHPSLSLRNGDGSWEIRPATDLTAMIKETERRRDSEEKDWCNSLLIRKGDTDAKDHPVFVVRQGGR
jgi:hypothetical protein